MGLGDRLLFGFLRDGDGALLLGDLDGTLLLDRRDFQSTLGLDLPLLDAAVAFDFSLLDLPFGGDTCLLRLLLLGRLEPRDLRTLLGLAIGHFLLLREHGEGLLLRDAQLLLLGHEVLLGNLHRRVLLDVIALLGPQLGLFGQLGQAFCIEGIVGIEKLHRRLVDPGERDRFQFEAVLHQVFLNGVLHRLDEILPHVEQLLHGHRHGSGTQRIDEFVLDQFLERGRVHRPLAEGLRGLGDALKHGTHPHEECGDRIDPHPVLGEQAVLAAARDLQLQRVHVDWNDLMEAGQHDRAAVHDHLLPAETGADEGKLLRRALVEAHDDDADDQHGQQDNRAEHERGIQIFQHGVLPLV